MKSRPDPISMRLPEELKDSLADAAKAAGRSLNAEIRMRLEWSFEGGFDGQASDKMLANEVENLRAELRGTVGNMSAEMQEMRMVVDRLKYDYGILEVKVSHIEGR